MAKYVILFKGLDSRGNNQEPEEVAADDLMDHPPFVDFYVTEGGGGSKLVARYRQDDIRRITRED